MYCNQNVQMLWDSEFSFSTDGTEGENSSDDEKPDDNADDEEFLGYTGYRYMSPWNIRKMVHKYVLRNDLLQDNKWGIVDAMALQNIHAKTLDTLRGQGKSQVVNRYKNGVELRID